MSTLDQQSRDKFKELYGNVTDEKTCDDRNYRQIAYEATMCGKQLSDVLTNYELELLSKGDADYEVVENDLLDYGRPPKGAYVREQVVMLLRISGCSEDLQEQVAEATYDEVKPVFIVEEQKKANFSFYMRKLDGVQTKGDLTRICKTVLPAQKRENGGFFFPTGKSKEFWTHYREVKAGLNDLVIKEIKDFITSCARIAELSLMKKDIYSKRLGEEASRPLYDLCDEKMDSLRSA